MGLPVYITRWSRWRNRRAPTKQRLCQNTALFRVNMMGGSFARTSSPEERLLGGISNATGMVVKFGTVRHTILLWYFRANYNIDCEITRTACYQPSRDCEIAWEHHEIECSDSQNGDALGGVPAGGHLCPRPGSGTAALQFGEGLRARFENMEATDGALSPWGTYG